MIRYILLSLFFLPVFSSEAQLIYHPGKIVTIGKAAGFFIDTENKYTPEQIRNTPGLFRQGESNVPNFGLLKNAAMWVHVRVTNTSNSSSLILEVAQPQLNEVKFYYPDGQDYKVSACGLDYPFASRMVNHHNYLFDLNIPPDSTRDYYLRLKSATQMALPIFVGARNDIMNDNLLKNLLFGVFFGIILVMFFYNLFIYFTVRDSIYLYYVLYILVVGLTQSTIEGYTFEFLWPKNVYFASKAFFVFTALVNICGLEFVRNFLHTQKFLPRADKIALVLYGVYFVAIILTFAGQYFLAYNILQDFAGLVSLYMLIISITIARTGYRPAKFFVIAWIPLIIGIIIYVLKDLGKLPYNVATNYSITVGSSLEVMLLSFALADKINIFRKEKEQSQAQAMEALKENERIVKEQNLILERKVNERTYELKLSNDELNKTLVNLKEAQTQLVEQEKMASLGQLTAGVAHEINNPINFVTSNVKPLNRDVNMILEAMEEIERIAVDGTDIAAKKNRIEEFKTEIDYDYVKMEIEQLLTGIADGASRTAEIVKGLRIFSRLDEDALKKADINEGLDSTLVITNNLLGPIKLHKAYGNLPLIDCYPGKLNQVFLNIISNAIYAIKKKFENRPGGLLSISTFFDENFAYIKIGDNGTGIEDSVKKRIFDPFFTTKEVGEGTGLGLSIAYNTINKHNGQILVNSEAGVGTEFVIKLPLTQR